MDMALWICFGMFEKLHIRSLNEKKRLLKGRGSK
jgi:hypothetical protein